MSLRIARVVVISLCGMGLVGAAERRTDLTETVRREGLKVVRALASIEAESASPAAIPRRMDFTEGEFNSYIAYRIATEKEEMMRELRFKLFDRNRVEGMVLIDLRGQHLPSFLKPEMTLYFESIVLTENGRVRLEFRRLFLEGQEIPVAMLDVIIYIAAKLGKTDPASIKDWYVLPFGIKELRTGPGRISVLY